IREVVLAIVVRVYRLAEKHYFAHAVRDDCLDFAHHVCQLATALASSCIRNDAVRAAIVATALHWYPCLHAIEAARGEVFVVFLEVEAREHATLTVPCLLDEFGKCTVAIGADDQAYMPGVLQQLRAQALRHAASNT